MVKDKTESTHIHDMPAVRVKRGEAIEKAIRRFRERCSIAGVGEREKNDTRRENKRRVMTWQK
jgi:ribosomal protein S21